MGHPEPLPPWRPLLRGAREREGREARARWLQLATVAVDGTPRLRTLVFRGWAGPATLDLLSDARSAKAAELSRQPAVELCWLLPKARSQFRLRGTLQSLPPELEERERQRHWRQLTPGGRAAARTPPAAAHRPGASGAAGAHGPPPSPSSLAAGDRLDRGTAQPLSHTQSASI